MNQNDAATLIQQNWRRFASERKQDSDLGRQIAGTIGRKIEDLTDFRVCLAAGRVLVQANGDSGNPRLGHSCFYVTKHRYALETIAVSPRFEGLKNVSKYSFEDDGVRYRSIVYCGPPLDESDSEEDSDEISEYVGTLRHLKIAKLLHVIEKGVIFVLHDEYTQHLRMALHLERIYFRHQPFAYGLHYNCNRFVTKD
jgi:hypothetical protein